MDPLRNSTVFYESFYDATKDLPPEMFKEAWTALFRYAFYGIDPGELDPIVGMFYKMAKPLIDKAAQAREWGSSGGRPKKRGVSETERGVLKEKRGVSESEKAPIYDVDVDVDEDKDVDVDVDVDRQTASGKSGSHTPSFKEVADEVAEQGYRISAVKFFDYYEKQGWKTNEGDPIRNWKTMLKVWDMKEKNESPAAAVKKKSGNRWNNFDQRDYSKEDLEMQLLELGDYVNENQSNHQTP